MSKKSFLLFIIVISSVCFSFTQLTAQEEKDQKQNLQDSTKATYQEPSTAFYLELGENHFSQLMLILE